MPHRRMRVLLICLIVLCGADLRGQNAWARADSAIVRLTPDRFPALPTPIRSDLERRGCRVPQSSYAEAPSAPSNVIRGAFKGPSRSDWAVLCSVRDTSVILVYQSDASAATDSIERGADRNYLQGMGGDRIAFSRGISVAKAASIRYFAKEFGGATPPALDHEGIDNAFQGKASVIHYYFEGKWLRLQGMD